MADFSNLVKIRNYKEEDKNFILASFLKGLYYGESWFSMIDKDDFMAYYKNIAQAMLTHPNILIKVACVPEYPDDILGYCIQSKDGTMIHWVFIKSKWRNNGIARALVPQSPKIATHLSKLGKTLLIKFPNIRFNPFALG